MTDYRLDDLAALSGVSARNIRAYRERGLLDPPRREGRSAFYGDHHLGQLHAITRLLGRGFSTAHIAEFIAGVRGGHDLSVVLGLADGVFAVAPRGAPEPSGLDPAGAEVRRLRQLGLADVVDGAVVFSNRALADVVAAARDPVAAVRAVLEVADVVADRSKSAHAQAPAP